MKLATLYLIVTSTICSMIACYILARDIKRNKVAIEQLNMRIGLVEVIQWRAANPISKTRYVTEGTNRYKVYTGNGLQVGIQVPHNTNYTVIESEPR